MKKRLPLVYPHSHSREVSPPYSCLALQRRERKKERRKKEREKKSATRLEPEKRETNKDGREGGKRGEEKKGREEIIREEEGDGQTFGGNPRRFAMELVMHP